jgi:transcription initiation factor IIE alpha subunit
VKSNSYEKPFANHYFRINSEKQNHNTKWQMQSIKEKLRK